MANYISVPIDTEPEVLTELALDRLALNIEGFDPSSPHLEVILIEAISLIASEVRTVASDVPTAIYKDLGTSLLGVVAVAAAPATVTSTWTMRDDQGYTVPAGTIVGLRNGNGDLIAFEVVEDVIVLAGDTVTAAGEVILEATEEGEDANDLGGTPELVDALDYVTTIALVGTSSGGADEEDDDVYLRRLTDEIQLLTPRPILPRDFEILARRVPGVWRTVAIDGYNPGDTTYDNERMVAIAALDEAGEPVSAPVKSAIDDYLQGLRETDFIVHVIDPTETDIDVTFAAVCLPGNDPASVEAWAEEAVIGYLNPINWGVRSAPEDMDDPRTWRNVDKVRFLEIAEVINRSAGIDYITSLTVNGAGADVTLSGAAPIPNADAIAGTVSAP